MFYPYKEIKPSDVKPGEEYDGYKYGDYTSYCTVNIQEDGTAKIFNQYPLKESIDCFLREMTRSERKEWEKEQVDLSDKIYRMNLVGIHTDLYDVGDASHEMWNGWVCSEWHKQLLNLKDENFFIVGIAPAPYGCHAIDHPVAIVAEDFDSGNRFWCHSAQEWIEDMRKDSIVEFYKITEDLYGNI